LSDNTNLFSEEEEEEEKAKKNAICWLYGDSITSSFTMQLCITGYEIA
jgi:hypothetical protein